LSEYIDPTILPSSVKVLIGPGLYIFPVGPTVGTYEAQYEKRYAINTLSNWVYTALYKGVEMRFPLISLPLVV
jgi:hypothetical protein